MVKDTDKGYKQLLSKAKALKSGAMVRAGIHAQDGAAKEGELTVIEVATVHEFGTSTIPQRSFVRAWYGIHYKDVKDLFTQQLVLFLQGKATQKQVLGRVGAFMAGGMKERIANRIPPPLKPATVRRKGSSVPLIDTGQLRNSITFSYRWGAGAFTLNKSDAAVVLAKQAKTKAAQAKRDAKKAAKQASRARVKAVKGAFKAARKGAFSLFRASRRVGKKALKKAGRLFR